MNATASNIIPLEPQPKLAKASAEHRQRFKKHGKALSVVESPRLDEAVDAFSFGKGVQEKNLLSKDL